MATQTKRVYSRKRYVAPIMYANYTAEKYYRAQMYNSSVAGMYFESDDALQPGAGVCIKMVNYVPETDGTEAYRFYQAKVKWCKNIAKADASYYGVGVQYVAKGHTVCEGNVCESGYSCSLCGENHPYDEIHETEDFVYLCSHCFKQLEALPDGRIKKSIDDFLIGNVI
jgi:hypothetical protein